MLVKYLTYRLVVTSVIYKFIYVSLCTTVLFKLFTSVCSIIAQAKFPFRTITYIISYLTMPTI